MFKVGDKVRYKNEPYRSDVGIADVVEVYQNGACLVETGTSYGKCTEYFESLELVESSVTAPNPKQRYGDKKPALAQLPLAGMAAQSLAHMDGDYKYGFRNWRDDPVEAITYVNAALRHLLLWAEGEEDARDTQVPNLGGVMACCAILLDAQANGTLIDNRSKSTAACNILHDYEEKVSFLRQKANPTE